MAKQEHRSFNGSFDDYTEWPASVRGGTAERCLSSFLRRLLPRSVFEHLSVLAWRVRSTHLQHDFQCEPSPADAAASASISIVVAIHDAPAVTRRCLASLEKYASQSQIILVDDASRLKETLEVIRHFCDRNKWTCIRHEKSRGHSEACRAGARLADRPYLCLLNSDTVVTPWCWSQIRDAFEQDAKIGIAGPSTSSSGNRQALPVAAGLRLYWNDNQICAFAHRLLTACPNPVVVDLPWICGFAFFIRRSLWDEVGGFDENLPDYNNEIELCGRIAAIGYRLVWVRNSYIHHLGEQSYGSVIGVRGIDARREAAEIYTRKKVELSGGKAGLDAGGSPLSVSSQPIEQFLNDK